MIAVVGESFAGWAPSPRRAVDRQPPAPTPPSRRWAGCHFRVRWREVEIGPSAARCDQMPNYVAATRDLRIDFCRGLVLYMILVDHVIGDPISRFTLQNFGFSDAAEAFVF